MPSLEMTNWPPDLQVLSRYVAGVFVNGCVARGDGSRFRRRAHAHTMGDRKGWICYLSAKHLGDADLAKHEAAHLISGEGHTRKFRAALTALHGGELPRRERMVPRAASWECRTKFYHGACRQKRCPCWCHRKADHPSTA